MKTHKNFTAIIEREGDGYVSLCPEFDIASQGETVEEARQNLAEALELFFEHASESEIKKRLHNNDSRPQSQGDPHWHFNVDHSAVSNGPYNF